MSYDANFGELAYWQSPLDVNATIYIRRVCFAASDQVTALKSRGAGIAFAN